MLLDEQTAQREEDDERERQSRHEDAVSREAI
jgi:hypothetical protein